MKTTKIFSLLLTVLVMQTSCSAKKSDTLEGKWYGVHYQSLLEMEFLPDQTLSMNVEASASMSMAGHYTVDLSTSIA